jgi:hypothetical protein
MPSSQEPELICRTRSVRPVKEGACASALHQKNLREGERGDEQLCQDSIYRRHPALGMS